MDRTQAIALLKGLVESKLIEPAWISIEKTREGAYRLKVKCVQDLSAIKQFCGNNQLVLEEQDGFCVIFKPR